MEYKDYYATLGVERGASQDAIKRAYRKLARKYHPDVSSEPDAEAQFQALQEAYEVLKDPEKRAAYDQLGHGWQQGQDFRPPPDWEQQFDFRGGGFTRGDASAFSDFFESLFGRGGGGFGGFGRRGFEDVQARGPDHFARVELTLEEAYHGGKRPVTLESAAADAYRRVQASPRTLNVRIPPGVTEGQQIRLQGQGGAGAGRAPRGDLYLEVVFRPHSLFRADGRDIHLDLPIAPWEAALGATVAVPTLGGEVDTKIPAGAHSGQRLRLRGRGLPGSPPGDQYLHLRIVLPQPKGEADRELFERMRQQMHFDPRATLRQGVA
ncbi:MAG: DnaJ C-terminal domain-containing protein [Halofilum sp. (in: g-proteobacteria)]